MEQEVDGPQAEQLDFVPYRQIFQNSKSERRAELCQDKRLKNHIFLILKVKETFLTTHVQKGSFEVKRKGVSPHSK